MSRNIAIIDSIANYTWDRVKGKKLHISLLGGNLMNTRNTEIIYLTKEQLDELERIIKNNVEPTEALKELMTRPRRWADNPKFTENKGETNDN